MEWLFSGPAIITASAVLLACLVGLAVLCAKVRVRVETKVEVSVND
jgi:hypothetical protein